MFIFDFNSSERRGLLVLAILIVFGIGFKYTLPYLIPETKTDFTKFKKEISELEFAKEQELKGKEEKRNKYQQYNNYKKYDKKKYYNKKKTVKYFKLNPNTATISDWQKFGFSQKQSKVIFNYIKKAGGISKKEQLKKIFVIDDKKYKEMLPYIIISKDDIEKQNNNTYNNKYSTDQIIELNSTNKSSLTSIRGIGDTYAERIIKYRNLLGGFYSKEQLKEVYGIKPEVFEKIKDFVKIDKSTINKLNVNFSDIKTLSVHPYISYKDAKAIVNYRTKNGFIKNIDILYDKKIITNSKLKHYLVTQD